MITKQIVSDQLLAYLNEAITRIERVDWAENVFIEGGFTPDDDIPVLRDVVSYLAAADTTAFPLTWDVCLDFLRRLGTPVKVVPLGSLAPPATSAR